VKERAKLHNEENFRHNNRRKNKKRALNRNSPEFSLYLRLNGFLIVSPETSLSLRNSISISICFKSIHKLFEKHEKIIALLTQALIC
jgi:hypothetical protein